MRSPFSSQSSVSSCSTCHFYFGSTPFPLFGLRCSTSPRRTWREGKASPCLAPTSELLEMLQQLLRLTQAVLPQENPSKGSTRWRRPPTSPPQITHLLELLKAAQTAFPERPAFLALIWKTCSKCHLHPRIMRRKTTRAPCDYKGATRAHSVRC